MKYALRVIAIILSLALMGIVVLSCVGCDDFDKIPTPIDEKKAIIIIPGILASALVIENEDESIEPEPLWDPFVKVEDLDIMELMGDYGIDISTLFNKFTQKYTLNELLSVLMKNIDVDNNYEGSILYNFQLNPDGTSLNPNVKAATWDDERRIRYGAINSYKTLALDLEEAYGDEYEVSVFNYDWRLSNLTSYQALEDYINENSYTNVILIGHSMGGIVANGYICKSEENRKKVDGFISIATPYYGSLSTLSFLENPYGYLYSYLPMIRESTILAPMENDIRSMYDDLVIPLFKYLTTLFQLLPTEEFLQTPQYEANEEKSYLKVNGQWLDCSDLIAMYQSRPWAKDENGTLYEGIRSYEEFVNSQYVTINGERVHGSKTVDTFYIAGSGVSTSKAYVVGDGYIYSVRDDLGDGTVSLYSAILGQDPNGDNVLISEGNSHIPLACAYDETIFNAIHEYIDSH